MSRRTSLSRICLVLLVSSAFILNPGTASSSPSSDFTVGIHLDEYYVKIQVSTEHDVNYVVPGWVDINDMRIGETVSVQVSSTNGYMLYAGPDPPHFIFERDGRQFFNLTLTMREDAPIAEVSHLIVSADAKTYIDGATASVELYVEPVYEISATARVVQRPTEVAPGEEAKGVLKLTNTGTIYGEYHLVEASDPDGVVDDIRFSREREVELTPQFYEDFEFRFNVPEDAPPGTYQVTVELWASTQYDLGGAMDTFTLEVEVVDDTPAFADTLLVTILIVVAVLVAAAYMLRRKG